MQLFTAPSELDNAIVGPPPELLAVPVKSARLRVREGMRLETRRISHLISAGLGLCLLTFAPSAHALSGTDGTPGDPGISITNSGDVPVGPYTGTDGGVGSGGEFTTGAGGQGGAGAEVNGSNILVNFNDGQFTGGHGGVGSAGFAGGVGGAGGNGLDVLSPSGTTTVNGGTFTGSDGGEAGNGTLFGDSGGKGGNAVYLGSSNVSIFGGNFQAGHGGSGTSGSINGTSANGLDGVDFYVNGGTMNLLGTFTNPVITSGGYGTFTGTFSYNFGKLDNQTYTFYDAGGGNLDFNGVTEIKAVPEASSLVLFALMLTGGCIALRRHSTQRIVA
jgi:hypothetical protein